MTRKNLVDLCLLAGGVAVWLAAVAIAVLS